MNFEVEPVLDVSQKAHNKKSSGHDLSAIVCAQVLCFVSLCERREDDILICKQLIYFSGVSSTVKQVIMNIFFVIYIYENQQVVFNIVTKLFNELPNQTKIKGGRLSADHRKMIIIENCLLIQ